MATMQELRAQAKAAGVPVSEIRAAESVEELQGLIAGSTSSSKGGKKVARVIKKKTVAKKTTARKTTVAKRGPGRPKGSTNKPKTTTRKPATRKTTVAKSSTTAKNGRRNYTAVTTDGRHILEDIDYSDTDGWNPRAGSAPDVILKALRKYRGNREKVFDALKGNIWDFVGKSLANGKKRSKESAEAYLRYRIARTDWDFALKTGQHKKSNKRVEYGTGGTGAGTFKRAKKSARKAPAAAPKRRGRPPKAKTASGTGRKRGRPVGSRNKTTKTTAKRTMKRR